MEKNWKNALPRNVKVSLKKFLDPDLVANDCQNLINSSLPMDTSVVKLLWKSDQKFSCEDVSIQTDKLTNKKSITEPKFRSRSIAT